MLYDCNFRSQLALLTQMLTKSKFCIFTIPSATVKSLHSCLILCDPIDGSPPGSPIPGILQARTLEWVAICFSNAWKRKVKVKLLSCVRLFVTPWTAAHQAPPSMGFSRQEYWSGCHCLLYTIPWNNIKICNTLILIISHLTPYQSCLVLILSHQPLLCFSAFLFLLLPFLFLLFILLSFSLFILFVCYYINNSMMNIPIETFFVYGSNVSLL